VIKKIRQLSDRVSVFVSSHILSEIEQMCEDVTMIDLGKIVVSDSIRNIKKRYISNLYILDTDMNEKIFNQLKNLDFISSVRIDEIDGKIHIVPKNADKLRESIPKIIIDNKSTLVSFSQPELSLQDIFMEIMMKKGGNDNENK